MRNVCRWLTTALALLATGCEKNNENKIHRFEDPQNAQLMANQVLSDDKCEMLADSIFGRKMISANADDSSAILLEFKWVSSKDTTKEQKGSCYLK
ncbi:MAG TPA: hypothetical protein VEL47_01700 [Myxococcota bacterium]|nr:hypothetical protein [Myxococcota bacterium]